ncbi:MAG: hypothetical protein U0S12_04000 [Fimbriimonadales bacterium]
MRGTLAKVALAAVLAGTFVALPAVSLAQSAEEIRIDVTLKDADMIAATKMLTNETGLQFVIEQNDSEAFPRITLSLKKVTAEDAIRYICQAANAYYHRDDNGVYIISRKKPETTTAPPVTTVPAVAKKNVVLRKLKLQKADAEDVYNQIAYGYVFDEINGWRKINRFKEATSAKMLNTSSPIVLMGDRNPQQFTPINSQQFAQPTTARESGNGILLPGESAGQGALGEGGGGRGGGFQGGGGAGAGGGQAGGGGGQGQGQTLSSGGLIPQGIQYITFDPTDNSIIVQGTDEEIKQIQDAISFFDVAPKQVIIKVEFITTSNSINKALGFDWLYQRGSVFAGARPGSFARAGDPIFVNWATGNITTRMRTLLQEGFGKTVQAPVLRTLNNQAAAVTNTVNTWIFVNQITGIGNGNVINSTQPIQLPIVTTLIVRPRINEDGTITMTLSPQLSDVGQFRRSPDGQELPDILTQTISVVARVKNNETIVLGGLTRKQDVGSQSRFPILGDLPIIGQFFRATTRDRNNSELLIFVTPTIIEDEDSGIGP